jgi:hypothetical protein
MAAVMRFFAIVPVMIETPASCFVILKFGLGASW